MIAIINPRYSYNKFIINNGDEKSLKNKKMEVFNLHFLLICGR